MQSLITTAESGVDARDLSGMGALPASSTPAFVRVRGCADLSVHRIARIAGVPCGPARTAAAQAKLAGPLHTSQFDAYQTRPATAGGGNPGSHPARDPV